MDNLRHQDYLGLPHLRFEDFKMLSKENYFRYGGKIYQARWTDY